MLSMKKRSFGIVSGIAFLLLANFAYAGGTKVSSEAGICTFHSTLLFLDGTDPSTIVTCTGSDQGALAGPFQGQSVAGWQLSGQHCTMSNGDLGVELTLYFGAGTNNYPQSLGQLFYDGGSATDAGTPPTIGTECLDHHNYTFEGTANYNVTGGTGPYERASGTISTKFQGSILAADSNGFSFGNMAYTSTSSITTK